MMCSICCVAPVAKAARRGPGRMLAYNGSIPGPTLRVPEGAEIVGMRWLHPHPWSSSGLNVLVNMPADEGGISRPGIDAAVAWV
jgi:hypothetical protein